MDEKIVELAKRIIYEAKQSEHSIYLLDDLMKTVDLQDLHLALEFLENKGLIQPESFVISTDEIVSFVDVRLTSKGCSL